MNRKYNKTLSCDYLDFSFMEPHYRELLEFHTIAEFNRIRGKEFISYQAFHGVYEDAQQAKPYAQQFVQQLVDKLSDTDKSSVVIVSGIPGAGKGKLADYLARQLLNENVRAVAFKMPQV